MRRSILEVRRWIWTNPQTVKSCKDVALLFGRSPEALRKEFSRRYGISMARFVRSLKVSLAAGLLRTTNLRWFEIVDRLGLGRPENASRMFKRERGVTVRDFRNASPVHHR